MLMPIKLDPSFSSTTEPVVIVIPLGSKDAQIYLVTQFFAHHFSKKLLFAAARRLKAKAMQVIYWMKKHLQPIYRCAIKAFISKSS